MWSQITAKVFFFRATKCPLRLKVDRPRCETIRLSPIITDAQTNTDRLTEAGYQTHYLLASLSYAVDKYLHNFCATFPVERYFLTISINKQWRELIGRHFPKHYAFVCQTEVVILMIHEVDVIWQYGLISVVQFIKYFIYWCFVKFKKLWL